MVVELCKQSCYRIYMLFAPLGVKYKKLRLGAFTFQLHSHLLVDNQLFFRYSDHAFWVPFLRLRSNFRGIKEPFLLPSLIFCLSDSIAIKLMTNKRAIPVCSRIALTGDDGPYRHEIQEWFLQVSSEATDRFGTTCHDRPGQSEKQRTKIRSETIIPHISGDGDLKPSRSEPLGFTNL